MTNTLNRISDNVKGCFYGKADGSVSSHQLLSDNESESFAHPKSEFDASRDFVVLDQGER